MRGGAGRLVIVLKIPSVWHPRGGVVNLRVGFLRRTNRGSSDSLPSSAIYTMRHCSVSWLELQLGNLFLLKGILSDCAFVNLSLRACS